MEHVEFPPQFVMTRADANEGDGFPRVDFGQLKDGAPLGLREAPKTRRYVREILLDPDPRLHKRSKHVSKANLRDPLFQQTLDDMAETCRAKNGIGLSGCQIGLMFRVFVIADATNEWCFVNPTVYGAGEREWLEESCLSRPGFVCEMHRYKLVRVVGWDRFGHHMEAELRDTAAQCAQHEIDHASGMPIWANVKRRNPRLVDKGGRSKIYLPA